MLRQSLFAEADVSGTYRVDLAVRKTKSVNRHDGLRRKGLIDLIDVNVLLADTSLGEHFRDSDTGSDTHDSRRASNDGRHDKLGEDGQAELLSVRTPRQENSGGSVGNLGGVSGVGGTVLLEGGPDLGEGFGGNARSNSIVLVDNDFLLLLRLGVNPLGLQAVAPVNNRFREARPSQYLR